MIAQWGQIALILGLSSAILLAIVPMIGSYKGWLNWQYLAKPLAFSQFLLVLISFTALAAAFINDDFSIAYVASHSNSRLPWFYKFSALWA